MKIPRYNLAILDFALNVFSLTLPIWVYHIKEQASRIFYSDLKHKRAWQGMFANPDECFFPIVFSLIFN